MEEFIRIILLFFIYSVIGWLWETFYCSLKAGKFVYRGFLIGPYCPIYGFGVLSVLYFIEPYQDNIVVLFILSAVLVSVLEYLTSYILERLFHTTWWDYKHLPLNINGRIALPISLFWGFACVLIVKVIHPKILIVENFLAEKFGLVLPIVLVVLILADTIYTVINMASFQKVMKKWSDAVEESKTEFIAKKSEFEEGWNERKENLGKEFEDKIDSLGTTKEEWVTSFRAHKEERQDLPHFNFNQRRILKNYSGVKPKGVVDIDGLKRVLAELKEKEKK